MDAKKKNIKSLNRKKDEFISVASEVGSFFKEEDITLDFTGYLSTLKEYVRCSEFDVDTLDILVRDLNLWGQYFGDLFSLVTSIKLKYENKKTYLEAFPPSLKTDRELALSKYKVKRTKLFLKHIRIQQNMFQRLHYHCSKMLNEACEHYTYRAFN